MTIDQFFNTVKKNLAAGKSVRTQLGNFHLTIYSDVEGLNTKTGQRFVIPGKKMPFFLPSDELLKAILGDQSLKDSKKYLNEMKEESTAEKFIEEWVDVKSSDVVKLFSKEMMNKTEIEFPDFGRFVLRTKPDFNDKRVITFSPTDSLRALINKL